MPQSKPKVIFLMGPTASGKSQLALAVAQNTGSHIVSVDSAMIYRGMDIGTDKPTKAMQAACPHHLLDIRDPHQVYSVAAFCQDAHRLIHDIHRQGAIPILVGGSMLYFYALQHGLSALPPAHADVRQRLYDHMKAKGLSALYAQLQQVDPERAACIKPQDTQRILRALEVYHITGRPFSAVAHGSVCGVADCTIVPVVCTVPDHQTQHQRMAARLDHMLAQGFMDEMQGLYQHEKVHADLPSMRAVGYRQAWQYLEGHYDAQEMKTRTLIATRQLAKRQRTWLKRHWPHALQLASDAHGAKRLASLCGY